MQETKEQKLMKRVEKIAMEDKKTMETYHKQKPEQRTYKVGTTKSNVRNFRDFEIYTSMQTDDIQPYGKYQRVTDYIKLYTNRVGKVVFVQQEGQDALTVEQLVNNLCRNQSFHPQLTVQELQTLTEHLLAGEQQQNKTVNQKIHHKMKEEGRQVLKDLYCRQLSYLQKKYSGSYLLKLSPSEYLKKHEELSSDFACIHDMKIFFATVQEEEMTAQAKDLLEFYYSFWNALQERHRTFVDGDFDGRADQTYKITAKRIVEEAKAKALFRKPYKPVTLDISSHFITREEQIKKAEKAEREYQKEIEKENILDDKLTKKAKPYQLILNAYAQYLEDKKLLTKAEAMMEEKKKGEYADVSEDYIQQTINDCMASIAEYEKKGIPTEEEIKRIQDTVDEIMFPVTYSFEEVTLDNFARISDDFIKKVSRLCESVKEISDDNLMKMYSSLRKTARSIRKEEDTIKNSSIYSTAATKYKDKPWILDNRKKLDGIRSEFPIYGRIEEIMEARIESIKKYGYTNKESFVQIEDMGQILLSVNEAYKTADKQIHSPISVTEALKVEIGRNRFENLNKISFEEITRELEACKRVKEFREVQPDFYHLGLSYADHEKAEAMCALLPAYEEALELTLRFMGIKKHGGTNLAMVEEQWRAAIKSYSIKAYRIETDYGSKKFQVNRIEELEKEKARLKEKKELWTEETSETEKELVAEVIDFICDPLHIQKKEELEDAINVVSYQKKIFSGGMDIIPTQEEFKSLSLFLYEAVLSLEQVDEKLSKQSYRDYALFANREEILACERKFYYLKNYFLHEDIKQEFLKKCKGNPAMEALEYMITSFSQIFEKVVSLAEYTGALEMEYAAHNGVKSMKIFMEGITTELEGKWIKSTALRNKKENSKIINELRTKPEIEARKEEIFRKDMEARLRKGVGKELIAADAKIFMANIRTASSITSLAGNLIGTPLQIFSWIKHNRRTPDHGSTVYDKWSQKYIELMETLGENHLMKEARLPMWQRGNLEIVPPVDLDGLFSSSLKKELNLQIRNLEESINAVYKEDFADYEFRKAIEAIQRYSTIVGIVNSDTIEMEMAFLDMFLKMTEEYEKLNFVSDDPTIMRRLQVLLQMKGQLMQNLQGTMADTLTEEELKRIDETTISYVEDTTFRENMEESNIQSIPLFLHEPNINDVKQSSIGDCWLVSAISALVKSSPDFVKSMFYDTGDGNVIVRLYAAEKDGKEVKSSNLLLRDKSIKTYPCYFKLRKHYETGWGNASDCTWVQLLEKAYALSGFNDRREMKVKGNKLYNVADELTYGHQGVAILHLTGIQPEELYTETDYIPKEADFYDSSFLAAVLDGFSENLLVKISNHIFAEGMELSENTLDYLVDIGKLYGATLEEKENIEKTIRRNYEKLKIGFSSETYEVSRRIVGEQHGLYSKEFEGDLLFESEKQRMEVLASLGEYFETKRNSNYTPQMNIFFKRCEEAFSQGATLSVAIPHCVDLLAAKRYKGRMFILLRDPFNIYNNEYIIENGQEITKEERFTTVISGHTANRRLLGDKDEIQRNAFRGTSWFDVKDLYKIVYGMYKVPLNIQPPNMKQ
ncbi:MAG: hypothetical protein IKL51_05770 [Lachnospiraceae bacterium]|nr:hypothetical protein [Lachnospiraceae bacterium]